MSAIKKHILAWGLALSLLLSGCSSLLERSYHSSTAHVDRPTVAEDPSVLRVENYRELVSAVLYLVSQGAEEGTIQLHDYTGPVESDLTAACAEVATEDPLGAYCVDYIKHEYVRVVSDYQAALSIRYRRTQEQVRSIVNVTGAGAIRTELQEALEEFADQVVLRVAYFSEDEESMEGLIRQAYYDTPAAALGLPRAEIALYPDSGRERVVEILLTYPDSLEELRRRRDALALEVKELTRDLRELEERDLAERAIPSAAYSPQGSTPYDALVEGSANAEGTALAYALLCREAGLACRVVEGALDGEPCFFNAVTFSDGTVQYRDLTSPTPALTAPEDMVERGYLWPGAPAGEPEEALLLLEPKEGENRTETP